jgi:CSLREA domain-containing protein
VSARSIRRSAQRRRARRTALATGAALGAGALLAPAAHAENLVVNSLADAVADGCDADCTLRDAVFAANLNAEADAITFAPGLAGTIRLGPPAETGGAIQINSADEVTITDDGPNEITISGDVNDDGVRDSADSPIFRVDGGGPVALAGLTLTEGSADGTGGGALFVNNDSADVTIADSELVDNGQAAPGGAIQIGAGDVEVVDSVLSGNVSAIDGDGGTGGAVAITADNSLTVSGSEFADNYALSGGAIAAFGDQVKYSPGDYGPSLVPDVTIEGSTLSDNGADGVGGAVQANAANVELIDSELSGNVSRTNGGAVNAGKYSSLSIDESTISGNEAGGFGGAIEFGGAAGKYSDLTPETEIVDSTISDNASLGAGGGIDIAYLGQANSVVIERSTISSNSSDVNGGGLNVRGPNDSSNTGPVDIANSTISGNAAAKGGGAYLGTPDRPLSPNEGVAFLNTTIADNRARTTAGGGGLYVARYDADPGAGEQFNLGSVDVYSSIVGDNTANGAANDMGNGAPVVPDDGISVGYSLVEAPGTAAVKESPTGTDIFGEDPELLPLGDFGGPTETHMLANSSPAIDVGANPLSLTTDQRGAPRTTDLPPVNPNDGTDMGSVELEEIAAPNTTIDSGPDGRFVVRSSTVTYNFSADQPGATFECSLDGGPFQPCTSPHQITGLENGSHTFAVRATADGITDPSPATATFTVDTSGPPDTKAPVTTIEKAPKRKIKTKKGKAKVKVAFSANEAGSTFQCKVDRGAFKPCASPLRVKLKAKLGKGAQHKILIRAVDVAGNVGEPVEVAVRAIRKKR